MAWDPSRWDKPKERPHARLLDSAQMKGLYAALVVVLGTFVAWLVLSPVATAVENTDGKAPKTKRTIKKNAPAVRQEKTESPTEKPKPVAKTEEKKLEEWVKRPGALRLPNGKVLTFPPPAEGQTRKVYAYGHLYECDHEGNFRDVSKRQLFKTAFEANFCALANVDKPFIPAFLKGFTDEQVAEMLKKGYEPKGDETEEELAEIAAYDQMRHSVLNYMSEGGKFDDFVDSLASHIKKERTSRAMCLREVMTLYKEGKVAEAKEMAEAANLLTEKEGYKPIRLPPHVQEAFDKVPQQ